MTFLSLNRPETLSDFDVKDIRSKFTGSIDLAPATLKYIRYFDLNERSHKGEFRMLEVYYHRESVANGSWWVKLPPRRAQSVFDDERVPMF